MEVKIIRYSTLTFMHKQLWNAGTQVFSQEFRPGVNIYVQTQIHDLYMSTLCFHSPYLNMSLGHIGLYIPDVYEACKRFEELEVPFIKTPDGGTVCKVLDTTCDLS